MTPFDSLRARLDPPGAEIASPGTLETSVAVMLAEGPRGLEALLIRRAERAGDPWSGHIGLPGGRREPSDTDLLMTAIRETREEVGVDLQMTQLLGALDDLRPSVPARAALVIRPFVFGLATRPATSASAEVSGSYWIPLESLQRSRGAATVKIDNRPVEVPCFAVAGLPKGLVVWGLTYRILGGLLSLID